MRPKKDYTTSVNHGKNKTRADEKAAINGKKGRAKTPRRKHKKAVQDAKHAFLMQMGYNQQRSNYDIITPIKDAKRSIKGENTYGDQDGAGANPLVDKFDATKSRLGMNKGSKKKLSHSTKGRVATSERKKDGAGTDYAPMAEANAPESIWNKTDRYRDAAKGGKHAKKGKTRNKVMWSKSRRNKDKGVK